MQWIASGLPVRSAEGRRLPADPCHTTVRTGPYTAVRGVTLALLGQRRETERAEVGIGQAEMQGLVLTGGPRTAEAGGRITSQHRSHAECDQSRPASARGSPLPPQGAAESPPDPTSQRSQHLRCLAEAEVVSPAHHIASQLFHCGLDADTLGPSHDLPDSLLKAVQGLGRYDALDLRAGAKAEPEKLSLLRSCHCTLRLIDLEFELLRNESRDALHYPLTRPLTANVNVAVVRIANKAMSPALQFPVEFVEHNVAEQGRKRSPLRSPFHAGAYQSVLHHPSI